MESRFNKLSENDNYNGSGIIVSIISNKNNIYTCECCLYWISERAGNIIKFDNFAGNNVSYKNIYEDDSDFMDSDEMIEKGSSDAEPDHYILQFTCNNKIHKGMVFDLFD